MTFCKHALRAAWCLAVLLGLAATGLQAQHAYTLARNSFEASFIDAAAKRRYADRLDQCFAVFS